ncbi:MULTISPECIES: hypothetical protein [Sporomusa]|uniref:hypothetical protein n=1 Tax=Sporomusa TaxID=2375 RepID=UPI0031593AAA
MDFIVAKEVYEKLNTVCFGVVVAKGLNNQGVNYEVEQLLSGCPKPGILLYPLVRRRQNY